MVEDGTALARRVRRGEITPPDDDVLADRYELLDGWLTAAGFDWYEVSNWAGRGGECRHNLGYWTGGNWWGVGPGAHGTSAATRWWNVKHPARYAAALAGRPQPGSRSRDRSTAATGTPRSACCGCGCPTGCRADLLADAAAAARPRSRPTLGAGRTAAALGRAGWCSPCAAGCWPTPWSRELLTA